NNRIPNLPERLEELRPTLEASEESPAHDGRGDAERPVDVWVRLCGIVAGFNVKSHPDSGIVIGISIAEVFF
uniref:Uncharacterized protein n=1 Tax=Saimiri boliviensis boliviensis TaxID=39432 RepID=A0A2K6TIT0_SAIBB